MKNIDMKNKRLVFLDLARGLAVFFMIMQHTVIIYGINEGENSLLAGLFVLAGTAPAAPVFMFIMGIFFLRSQNTQKNILRGMKLIGLGYLLNFLRFALPVFLAGEGIIEVIKVLMAVDILQLAGLSLIILSFVRKLKPSAWLVITVVVAIISPFLWKYAPKNYFFDLFWGTNKNIAFPLFPWLIYPLLGMYWGNLLWKEKDISRLIKKSASLGLLIFFVGLIIFLCVKSPVIPSDCYSRYGFQMHLMITGFVLVWLWLFAVIEKYVSHWKITKLLSFWSINVTSIYFIQWILAGWGILVFGYREISPVITVIIGLTVTIITHFLTILYTSIKDFIKFRKSEDKLDLYQK